MKTCDYCKGTGTIQSFLPGSSHVVADECFMCEGMGKILEEGEEWCEVCIDTKNPNCSYCKGTGVVSAEYVEGCLASLAMQDMLEM